MQRPLSPANERLYVSQTSGRARLASTRHPFVMMFIGIVEILVLTTIALFAPRDFGLTGSIVLGVMGWAVGAMSLSIGLWALRHKDEVERTLQLRKQLQSDESR